MDFQRYWYFFCHFCQFYWLVFFWLQTVILFEHEQKRYSSFESFETCAPLSVRKRDCLYLFLSRDNISEFVWLKSTNLSPSGSCPFYWSPRKASYFSNFNENRFEFVTSVSSGCVCIHHVAALVHMSVHERHFCFRLTLFLYILCKTKRRFQWLDSKVKFRNSFT